jgi:hypothetical protein
MKRFIDLGDQTGNIDYEAGEREFAFYCTVVDKFETFSGNQTWATKQEFIEDYVGDELQRFLGLIPLDWK